MRAEGGRGAHLIERHWQVDRVLARQQRAQPRERGRGRVRPDHDVKCLLALLRARAEQASRGGDAGEQLSTEDGERTLHAALHADWAQGEREAQEA